MVYIFLGNGRHGHPRRSEMTEEEFKAWLRNMDVNKDGGLNKKELKDALRVLGLNFCGWKVWRAMAHADLNHDKYIEGQEELQKLVDYARKRWGIVITADEEESCVLH